MQLLKEKPIVKIIIYTLPVGETYELEISKTVQGFALYSFKISRSATTFVVDDGNKTQVSAADTSEGGWLQTRIIALLGLKTYERKARTGHYDVILAAKSFYYVSRC